MAAESPFDLKLLSSLVNAEVYNAITRDGALDAVVQVLNVARLFRSALTRMGVTAEELAASEKASTHAEAVKIFRDALVRFADEHPDVRRPVQADAGGDGPAQEVQRPASGDDDGGGVRPG